jgi:glycosyltransferase involved in cell wall biosynthesis
VLISIIVPAFNEERLLGHSLAAIRGALGAFTARSWKAELIVCDNNSTDCTAQVAKAGGAQVVFEPVNQIARARNRGASIATGDWLIFVDADSRPSFELFSAVADEICSGRCLAGGCTVRLDEDHPTANRIVGLWNCLSRSCKLLAGSFIFCDRSAFREVGGFSQELFAGEELELSQKLKRVARNKGQRIVILYQHPLLTSARKVHLYRAREHLWFFAKAMFARRRILTNREACFPWYDGRR